MPRPSQIREKRQALLPVVARAFSELGYRRATTAQLAQRCGVQENILYRLWPDKQAMFLAAIDFVYEFSERTWLKLLQQPAAQSAEARGGGLAAHRARRSSRSGAGPRSSRRSASLVPPGSPLATSADTEVGARRLLAFEALHHGEFGHYRILFTGLAEADDPDIRDALQRVFARFHRFLAAQIAAHREFAAAQGVIPTELAAWAIIGLGTVANIGRELGLISNDERRQLLAGAGQQLLEGVSSA